MRIKEMRTIKHYIDEEALQEPGKIFMIAPEPGLSLTYGQLQEDSVRSGKHLTKLGLQKGDKVSFMLDNGWGRICLCDRADQRTDYQRRGKYRSPGN
jgi:acyl-coenzyme A synthetase/AMP-(fatty) acid ligase